MTDVGRTIGADEGAARGPETSAPPFVVRAIWFVLVGFWLTGLALIAAYALMLTIVGLPLAFWIFDRVPLLLTLRRGGAAARSGAGAAQPPLWARGIYFVLVGWWLGALWMCAAYALMVTVIGIPVGVMMLNRLPTVVTLQQG